MNKLVAGSREVPRIKCLRVENFRALRNVEIRDMTPLTVLIGPNGSGKSTLFDVFAFLAECLEGGLRRAWDRRGRAREIRTRGAEGPVVVELQYREQPTEPLITYRLEVNERNGSPTVAREWLRWKRGPYGAPFHFLDFRYGEGSAVGGERPESKDERRLVALKSPDLLAVNALGQFQEYPRVAALRDFIMSWHVSYFSVESARGQPETGPQERLSETGDNLANVIQYLHEQKPKRLERIFRALGRRVPRIGRVTADTMPDGRLLLQIKDTPFERPIMARFASDGTLKLLAYLVLLHNLKDRPFIGIEEPENFLHPRLLNELAEECRKTCEERQILVTTHSPFFLDGLRAGEVRVLWRDEKGHTQVERAADLRGVPEFMDNGALLGHLWMEGFFGVGDPLTRHGAPARGRDGKRR